MLERYSEGNLAGNSAKIPGAIEKLTTEEPFPTMSKTYADVSEVSDRIRTPMRAAVAVVVSISHLGWIKGWIAAITCRMV